MNGKELLSAITGYTSYSKYLPEEKRRETWEETVDRYFKALESKYRRKLAKSEILQKYFPILKQAVLDKKILPSMRFVQFAGKPIELAPNRAYNCSYMPVNSIHSFSEAMFLLLGGSGVGYSVQKHHVDDLPEISKATKTRRFVVGDSIEGWADAVKVLIKAYFGLSKTNPVFDFSDIRKKGTRLKTSGGRAPGFQPLSDALHNIRAILDAKADGEKLKPIEAHDIMCHIADAVLSGGIRRAALISLFSPNDQEMMECKSGDWFERHPYRGRANNSVVLLRDSATEEMLDYIKQRNMINGYGEPGIFWTNDLEIGTNPCAEISLRPHQFCNLCNVNVVMMKDDEDLIYHATLAAMIGTLQAGFTDFHYLRPIWQETTESEALIGVGLAGIASWETINPNTLTRAAVMVANANRSIAYAIGIKEAARTTCVKPDGNTGAFLGVSSGIHAWHSPYFIRHKRVDKTEPIYSYMVESAPGIVEDDLERPSTRAVFKFPVKAPDGAITRENESALELLERVKHIYKYWVDVGHVSGPNTHNVSVTVSVKEDEWDKVFEWMWNNRRYYSAISLMPYDTSKYAQAPFTECTKEEFEQLEAYIETCNIDLSKIVEDEDITNKKDQIACGGGACEI